jgi:hypothetical protein
MNGDTMLPCSPARWGFSENAMTLVTSPRSALGTPGSVVCLLIGEDGDGHSK